MTTVTLFVDQHLPHDLDNLFIPDQAKLKGVEEDIEKEGEGDSSTMAIHEYDGVCAICLDNIQLQDAARIKGCDHAYCVTCILQWATYHENPKCPQCKHPFESLNVHRALDGSLHDYMFEESVCLLVRAAWFTPLAVESPDDFYDEFDDLLYYQYEYEYEYEYQYQYEVDQVEDLVLDEDDYFHNSSSNLLRIGNRRWGDNGYIRAGHQEARPAHHKPSPNESSSSGPSRNHHRNDASSSSHEPKKDSNSMGRRAKRALKREAADKAKHQQHLVRLGRQ